MKNKILSAVLELIPDDSGYTTNKRQQGCLLRANEALNNVLETINNNPSAFDMSDLIAMDLKRSILELDEITGEVLTDSILDNIFDNFCIGK